MRKLMGAMVVLLLVQACEEDDASIFLDSSTSPAAGDAAARDAGSVRDAASARDGSMARDAARPLDSGTTNLDRAAFASVGLTDELDYSKRELWACRPGNEPNECHTDLTATEIFKDGGRRIVPHVRKEEPEFDCFYVYPTVDLSGGGNMTDFSSKGIALVQDPLRSQAARFNRLCEVYAPLYRQVSLGDGGVPSPNANPARGYADVAAAFDHYMKNFNNGRKFVLLGHSQGTSMLTALLTRVVDPSEELRAQMISAVILGGGPTTPPDAEMGGSFKNIPTCTTPGQTGCVLAYVSYAEEAPPGTTNGRFGKDTVGDAGVQRVICTEPAALANNEGKNYAGSYFRLQTNNSSFMPEVPPPAGVTTPFLLYRDYFKGACVREEPYSYLKVELNPTADDKRTVPAYRSSRLEPAGWGLHLVDFNVELEDLIKAVELQAAAAL